MYFFLSSIFITFLKNKKYMSKVYQQIVIQETENILEGLIQSNFFHDYGIEDHTFAREHLLDVLTEKYLENLLGKEDDELFTEEEFTNLLHTIIAGSILNELKEEGLMNSYTDENGEEMFFLTEEGKIELKIIEDELNKEGEED